MRIIFDIGHPAHFHLFKFVFENLIQNNHDIKIVAREKDCLVRLLEKTNFNYVLVKKKNNSLLSKFIQNIKTFKAIYNLAKQTKTDFIIGTSLVAPYVSLLTSSKSIIFSEDDEDVIPIFKRFVYPLADYIVTPQSLRNEDHGKKHLKYNGYHELAYLHPSRFKHDNSIRNELGLSEDEKFYLIRLVSLTAHHDIGQRGLSTEQALTIVEKLKKHGKVFISAERVVEKSLEPYLLKVDVDKIFDVIAAADIVIGDSQSITVESAVLGTPAIRCNTFVGRLSVLEELEKKYRLAIGFLPRDFDKMMQLLHKWLETDNLKEQWQGKRNKMLDESLELTSWIVNTVINLAVKD